MARLEFSRSMRRPGYLKRQTMNRCHTLQSAHLLGYDHETDCGEMDEVEQRLRKRFGLM